MRDAPASLLRHLHDPPAIAGRVDDDGRFASTDEVRAVAETGRRDHDHRAVA
jgi:hypothetical protein